MGTLTILMHRIAWTTDIQGGLITTAPLQCFANDTKI